MKTRDRSSGRSSFVVCAMMLLASIVLSGCGVRAPVFQPLTLDMSGDLAPRDPAASVGADIYCAAGNGTALIEGQWRPFRTTGFILPGDGALSSFTVQAERGRAQATLRGLYDVDGQRMVFCPLRQGPPGTVIDCSSLYAMDEDLQVGIKRTFDVPGAVQSAHISCAFSQETLRPL